MKRNRLDKIRWGCALMIACLLMAGASLGEEIPAPDWSHAFAPDAQDALATQEKIEATVVGEDEKESRYVLRLDKGSRDGIEEGQSVVTPDGLVGMIGRVEETSAEVLTLLSGQTAGCAVIAQRTADTGSLSCSGEGEALRLLYTPEDASLEAGDRLYTSGLDAQFPKGIMAGEIVKAQDGEVSVRAAVTPDALERVYVLTGARK